MTNGLRMSFAEWLSRMAERDLAPPGRTIAIYAAVFDITGNDQLGDLTGISGRSLDKWKKALITDGWVIIQGTVGGRGRGIQVTAALDEVSVSFTDIKPKKGSKYYPRNNRHTPAEFAEDMEPKTPANSAKPPQNLPPFIETPAKNTGVNPATLSDAGNNYARGEDINIYNINNNLQNITTPAACARPVPNTAAEFKQLSETLVTACNGALDNPANCQGLAGLATPIMWLNSGCDLQQDILPTLIGFGKSAHGKRIRSWDYFTRAVQNARDTRMRGMPPSADGGRRSPSENDTMRQIDAIVRGGR